MNFQKMLPVAVVGAFALGALAPHAQTGAQKIAYVDVQEVVKVHPQYGALDSLNKQAEAALKPSRDQIQAIQAKGNNATAADRQQYEQLFKTYQATAKTWEDKVKNASQPIFDAVNKAVGETAKAQGVAMVLNKQVAATSQVVIYADNSLDLTDAVKAKIKK